MTNSKIFLYIIPLYMGWVVVVLLASFFGLSSLPHFTQDHLLSFATSQTDYWIRWANWDGGHFRGIAENGYLYSFQVVFFPLYPLLMKALMLTGLKSLWAGLIISSVSTIIALFYLFKLTSLEYDLSLAKKAVLLLLVFPTSFYLFSVYSESLFLALTLGAFYYARKNQWFLAGSFAGLSAATRLAGAVVIASIFLEYFLIKTPQFKISYLWERLPNRLILYAISLGIIFEIIKNFLIKHQLWVISGVVVSLSFYMGQIILVLIFSSIIYFITKYTNWKRIFTKPTIWLLVSFLPLILYMIFLSHTQKDPLVFISHEIGWGRKLTFPWEASVNFYNLLSASGFFVVGVTSQILIEMIFFTIFFFIFIFSLFKLRPSYNFYYALSLILPISTGTLQAIHRYALVIFPIIFILAIIKNQLIYRIWLIFSLVFMGIFLVMFFNGYWVS